MPIVPSLRPIVCQSIWSHGCHTRSIAAERVSTTVVESVQQALDRASGSRMSFPDVFQGEADISREGELLWPRRAAVKETLDRNPGRWAQLELRSARHVLPVWTSRYVASRLVNVLDLAEAVLRGAADPSGLDDQARSLAGLLDELRVNVDRDGGSFAPLYAGDAVVSAAKATLGIQQGSGPELEVDPQDWTAAYNASLAWAGCAVWEDCPESADLRREFWLWWLDEARSLLSD